MFTESKLFWGVILILAVTQEVQSYLGEMVCTSASSLQRSRGAIIVDTNVIIVEALDQIISE